MNHVCSQKETIDALQKEGKVQQDSINKLVAATFGDGNGNPGSYHMTKEMYEVFTSANWILKVIIRVFAGIGVITGAIIGIMEITKRSK